MQPINSHHQSTLILENGRVGNWGVGQLSYGENYAINTPSNTAVHSDPISHLLNNPYFNNKTLLWQAKARYGSTMSEAISASFYHRGLPFSSFIRGSATSNHFKNLANRLEMGIYNPVEWDLASYSYSKRLDFKGCRFTETGLLVGYLFSDNRGNFSNGVVSVKDGVYTVTSDGDITIHSQLSGKREGKIFIALVPFTSLSRHPENSTVYKASSVNVIGVNFSELIIKKEEQGMLLSVSNLNLDSIKQPYNLSDEYYTFWRSNDND